MWEVKLGKKAKSRGTQNNGWFIREDTEFSQRILTDTKKDGKSQKSVLPKNYEISQA